MKISSKTMYGVISLVDIAVNSKDKIHTLREIAERQKISVKYLEQVFSILKRNKIVKSIKGAQGGYLLLKNPEDINLFMLLDLFESEWNVDVSNKKDNGSVRDIFEKKYLSEMKQLLYNYTQNITLHDIGKNFESIIIENERTNI